MRRHTINMNLSGIQLPRHRQRPLHTRRVNRRIQPIRRIICDLNSMRIIPRHIQRDRRAEPLLVEQLHAGIQIRDNGACQGGIRLVGWASGQECRAFGLGVEELCAGGRDDLRRGAAADGKGGGGGFEEGGELGGDA